MNIPKILNFNIKFANYEQNKNQSYTTNYGLKMASPISHDCVSFKKNYLVSKSIGAIDDAVSNKIAKDLKKRVSPSHNKFVKLMYEVFGDEMSTDEKKGLFMFKERIKSEFSIREKTTTIKQQLAEDEALLNKYNSMKEIDFFVDEIKDLSGMAFILEDPKAFHVFTKRFIDLVNKEKVNVVDLEYYRIPPVSKKGKIVESFDSLNTNYVNKIGSAIDLKKPNQAPILDEKPSYAGYSGLHITVKHYDGTYTEMQVMTKGMWNLKEIENLFYKLKEGKSLDPKYVFIEPFLQKIKPLETYASEKEKKQHESFMKKIKLYTKDAYKLQLKHPYSDKNEFLVPNDPEIEAFDFNKIGKLKNTCDEMAKKK